MNIAIAGPFLLRSDEAQALQAQLLAEKLPATIITHHPRGDAVAAYHHKVHYGDSSSLLQKFKLARHYRKHASSFGRIILPGTITNSLFKVLAPQKCVPLLSKRLTSESEEDRQKFVKLSERFPLILVQSKVLLEQLCELGVTREKIHFFYPIVSDYSAPLKKDKSFTLLFASSPRGPEEEVSERFKAKGVDLLLESAKELKITLLMLWRQDYADYFKHLVKEMKPVCEVAFVNKMLDSTVEYFALSSAVVVPYTSLLQSPEYPLSALHGLASGRPVLCSSVPELHAVIEHEGCGVVFDPDPVDCKEAIISLRRSRIKPEHCRKIFEKYFLVSEKKIASLRSKLSLD